MFEANVNQAPKTTRTRGPTKNTKCLKEPIAATQIGLKLPLLSPEWLGSCFEHVPGLGVRRG